MSLTGAIERKFLATIKEYQLRASDEALTRPTNPTEFGYGEAVGLFKGLKIAEQLFQKIIGEDDDE